MKKILTFGLIIVVAALLLVLFLWAKPFITSQNKNTIIATQTNENSGESNNAGQDNFDNIPHQVSDLKGLTIFKPGFDELAASSSNQFINQVVQLKGTISNLSQLQGIKFWPYDDKYISGQRTQYEFFWASPEGLENITADQHQGQWVKYTLKRYAGLSPKDINPDKDIYLVTGKYTGSDCGYWEGKKNCIPQIDILDIELIKL